MSSSPLSVAELLMALIHRAPTAEEIAYWSYQLDNHPLETVIRMVTSFPEHKDYIRNRELMFVPAGHFYSPIVDADFVNERSSSIFDLNKSLSGIDLHEQAQLDFVPYVNDAHAILPFSDTKRGGLRYHYDNGAFVFGDAVVYAAMIMKYRPKKIIEVGSGYSSALALDVFDLIEDYYPEMHFYDPYPSLVRNLTSQDSNRSTFIHERFVQDVHPMELADVEPGDFYFMDTTHIVKTGSDVLYHFEEVLPRLKSGVIIHLHDIFFPFEYPENWVLGDRLSWNEIYYFRAFLTNNSYYEILFFNHYMHLQNYKIMEQASPIFAHNSGASIWFRKK